MAPHPKRKHSTQRKGKRLAERVVKAGMKLVDCKNCNKPKLPHRACKNCKK